MGSYATPEPLTNFLDANDLGKHSYYDLLDENNGIVYTCRGGHIDIAHVRIAADYVKYLYDESRKHILNTDRRFTFKSNTEPSRFFVRFQYPGFWQAMPEKEKEQMADEISLELSQYLAYTVTTWHEILTWFGYKSVGVFPEFPSAFSWEDNYSNLLGTRLGAEAVQDKQRNFDEAMTVALIKELENLEVQPSQTSEYASEKMREKWYDGHILIDMKERNMDIGLDDGYVTPTLVPGICTDATPQSYPVPSFDVLSRYGFTITFEIEPAEMERGKILRIIYPEGNGKRIRPSIHFPPIMDYIKKQARESGNNPMPLKH
jgi:hypothetical protein